MKHTVMFAAAMTLATGAMAHDEAVDKAPRKAPETKICQQNSDFAREVGYCHAVRVGNTLHISGAAAPGPMPEAIARVYGSLKKTLEANGMTMAHVVKETVFATDLDAFSKHKDMRKALYGNSFPASSWVQVSRLYTPALVLEVEMTAVLP
jgi:2-iminobutanoate/2-iminopropanoate deaminase